MTNLHLIYGLHLSLAFSEAWDDAVQHILKYPKWLIPQKFRELYSFTHFSASIA